MKPTGKPCKSPGFRVSPAPMSEFEITKTANFDAAHYLPDGSAERRYWPAGRSRSPDLPPSISLNVPVVEPDRGLAR